MEAGKFLFPDFGLGSVGVFTYESSLSWTIILFVSINRDLLTPSKCYHLIWLFFSSFK